MEQIYWLTISNFLYIVVLIILATVTINMTIGNDGIFTRAKEAKQHYINAQEYEQEQINALDKK